MTVLATTTADGIENKTQHACHMTIWITAGLYSYCSTRSKATFAYMKIEGHSAAVGAELIN